jgi:hypothetical protein
MHLRVVNNSLFGRRRCKLRYDTDHPRGVVDVVNRLGGAIHHRRFNMRLISLAGDNDLLARTRQEYHLRVDGRRLRCDRSAADLRPSR